MAANIDTVFLCMSLNSNFSLRRLERYLLTAWDSGAAPVIVLTKSDLCEAASSKIAEAEMVAPGVDVIAVSSVEENVDAVKPYLEAGKTIAFLGSSGVGKSTLINRLALLHKKRPAAMRCRSRNYYIFPCPLDGMQFNFSALYCLFAVTSARRHSCSAIPTRH